MAERNMHPEGAIAGDVVVITDAMVQRAIEIRERRDQGLQRSREYYRRLRQGGGE